MNVGAGLRAAGDVHGAGPVVRQPPTDECPSARPAPGDTAAAAGAVDEAAGVSSDPPWQNVLDQKIFC